MSTVLLDPGANPALVIGALLDATGLTSKAAEEQLGLPKTRLSQLKKKNRPPDDRVARMQALVDHAPAAAAPSSSPVSATPSVVLLSCTDILIDPEIQQRAAMSEDTVADYVEALVADQEADVWPFPPAVVFRDPETDDAVLADGFHRVEAARQVYGEDARVPVTVNIGDRASALLHAVGANTEHGLRRTNADKRRAVTTLLKHPEWSQWSSRFIAQMARVSHPFVQKLRVELEADAAEAVRQQAEYEADAAGDQEPPPEEDSTEPPTASAPASAIGNVTTQVDPQPDSAPKAEATFRAVPGDALDGVRSTTAKLDAAAKKGEPTSTAQPEVRKTKGGGTQTVAKQADAPKAKVPKLAPDPAVRIEKLSELLADCRGDDFVQTHHYRVAERLVPSLRIALAALPRRDQTTLLKPLLDWNNQQRQAHTGDSDAS